MNNIEKSLRKICKDAWQTAGARFNAARILERREKFSTFSIAMFSAISLGIAVSQKIFVFPSGSPVDTHLTALSAFIGLFVLVISLIEANEKSLLKAEHLKRSADDLNAYWRKLSLQLAACMDGAVLTYEEANQLRLEYENILRSCQDNHEPTDLELFLAKRRLRRKPDIKSEKPESWESESESEKLEMPLIRAYWILLRSPFSGIGYFLVFWSIIVALIGVAIFPY